MLRYQLTPFENSFIPMNNYFFCESVRDTFAFGLHLIGVNFVPVPSA